MYRAILNGAHFRLLCYVQRLIHKTPNYSTTVFDTVDAFSYLSRNGNKEDTRIPKLGVIYNNFSGPQPTDEIKNSIDLFKLSGLDLDNALLELHDQNKHKQILRFVNDCIDRKIIIGKDVIKKLFRLYSLTGRVEAVGLLQNYCSRITPDLHKKNGEFAHYIAKAQCMKGNSKEGLTILTHAYKKNVNLRAFYRIIFKELIHDSVMNRSEASLVNFKKYVLEFSSRWKDNYPLVCFWHICWESDWFSDQMLADELLEASEDLQKILGGDVAVYMPK
ncbi:unnamed protein product [Leptosia nina]|uniref:Uncharacterized protein n=1 Tax=Leptosia nina TaxID=320188 RepID=A0AAV1JST7_9NEOP